MSEKDKSNRSSMQQKGQGKSVGTSILVAAASLLGTTLGVAASVPEPASVGPRGAVDQSTVDQDLARRKAAPTRESGASDLVAVNLKVNTTVPKVNPPKVNPSIHVKGATTTTMSKHSNQLKFNSNQIKHSNYQ